MSKERELLKEALKVLEWNGIMGSHDTYNSIKELLAQPEQEQEIYAKGYAEAMQQLVYEAYESGRKSALTEQEPVAWMLIDKETGARIPKAYKPEHGVNKDRWELYPLHTTLPKREPLSDEAICDILIKKEWKGFVELVRIIEKAHGIGGGE